MRKLITLSTALAFTMGCFAQYSLSFEANGLRQGDYRNMKQIEYVAQANDGANQVWDFSKSKIIKDFYIQQNEDVLNTPTEGYRLSCDEGGEKNTLFEITPNEKRFFGLENKNTVMKLDEPIVDLMFPFSYQDAKMGSYSGSTQTGSHTSYFDGNYITKADAWGTLILPDGNVYYNVLRVKVDKEYTEDYGSSTFKVKSIRYQYFAEGARYPIIITIEQEYIPQSGCKCSNSKYTAMFMEKPAVYKNDAVQIGNKNGKAKAGISSFNYLASPNPFAESLNIAFNLDKDSEVVIDILDLNGKTVMKLFRDNLSAGQYSYDFETSALFPGTYTLSITVDGKVYTNKMLKSGM
ncbi:MAG: T9SS type A sorting domain-containing protein [Paludibacteraceae bacterium]|nr:T9SS type A sorting domain-containing protein [Paludibacteraceae bacterium]MEE3483101.1 T9SS type A sorting domain-containing protein [Bacteroidales bacterium]